MFFGVNCDKLQNAFLPTMPQDDIEEVKEALLGARHANENPVFYRMCSACYFRIVIFLF